VAATHFLRARLGIAQSGFFVVDESDVRSELRKVSPHLGAKETQIRFKMQKDGEPVWDQTTIDRLWVTTQREAMIELGPPPAAANPQPAGASEQKVQKEQTKK